MSSLSTRWPSQTLPERSPSMRRRSSASFLSSKNSPAQTGSLRSEIRLILPLYLISIASADKGTRGFSRGKTTSGVVILVGGRQPTCLVCLASRRLSSVKNSEGLAGRSGALSARQRTQACWRKSRTITRQTATQSGPQACVPLSTDAIYNITKSPHIRLVLMCGGFLFVRQTASSRARSHIPPPRPVSYNLSNQTRLEVLKWNMDMRAYRQRSRTRSGN